MGGLSESTNVVATENCVSTTLDGETVVLDADAGEYYGLNEVASEVWTALQQPRTVREVRERVTDQYDVSPERCRADVDGLLAELAEKGLVTVREEDARSSP